MIRSFKVLGIAVLGVIAIAAMGSPAASAKPALFAAGAEGNVALHITQGEAAPNQKFHIAPTGECAGCIFACDTFEASATSEASAATVAPGTTRLSGDYFKEETEEELCEFSGLYAETDLNGCNYVFHAGEYTGEGTSTGTIDLICPEGAAAESGFGEAWLCRVRWPEQKGIGPVTYEPGEGSPQEVVVTMAVENMVYEGTGASLICNTSGFKKFNGTYEGQLTITASEDKEGGEPVPLAIVEG